MERAIQMFAKGLRAEKLPFVSRFVTHPLVLRSGPLLPLWNLAVFVSDFSSPPRFNQFLSILTSRISIWNRSLTDLILHRHPQGQETINRISRYFAYGARVK